MRKPLFLVLLFVLVCFSPVVDADDSFSEAIEVTDGYDDFWWVCYDDDCTEGPSWASGVDYADYYKLKVYSGDVVTWEIYNRADPHLVWLGVTFYNPDGSVIDLPADECSTCSDDDMMWVGDYETDSQIITYQNMGSDGGYVYMRVHSHDGSYGDGTVYDVRVYVDSSDRSSSSNSGSNNDDSSQSACSTSSDCPYRSGKIGTCLQGACIYIDQPDLQQSTNQDYSTSSSDLEFLDILPGILVIKAILLVIVLSMTSGSRRRRRASRSRSTSSINLAQTPTTTSFFDNPDQYIVSSNQYTLQANPVTTYPSQTQIYEPTNVGNNPNQYNPENVNYFENNPVQNQEPTVSTPSVMSPPVGPPRGVPTKPRNSLNGEFDDEGYEWLQWNANGMWYWRGEAGADWNEFQQ